MTNESTATRTAGDNTSDEKSPCSLFGDSLVLASLLLVGACVVLLVGVHNDTVEEQNLPVNSYTLENLKVPCMIAGINFTQAQLLKMTMGDARDVMARCEAIANARTEADNKQRVIDDLSKTK